MKTDQLIACFSRGAAHCPDLPPCRRLDECIALNGSFYHTQRMVLQNVSNA
jgi:hypothetical protein